jgi:hypothetical protein
MIYEIDTTAMKPGTLPEVVARTTAALPARTAISPLAAYWQTEIGALNRTLTVWPYRDMAHRAEVAAAVADLPDWPPDVSDLIASEAVEIVSPTSFMRPLTLASQRGVLEMRTYTFRPGTMPKVLDVWARMVPARERLSPLVACWTTEIGALHRFTHVWGYDSLDDRARIRAEALEQGIWPPLTREWRVSEESNILLPVILSDRIKEIL